MRAELHRLAGPFAVAALALAFIASTLSADSNPVRAQTATPPCSTVHLTLSNPQSGDLLFPGDYVIHGQAFDSAASTAPGIDRIQAFFDRSREDGGRFLGEVSPASSNPVERLGADGFALLVTIPDTQAVDNTHVVYTYARSAQSGVEQVVALNVQLKRPLGVGAFTPTPTPPPTVLAQATCGSPTPTPTFPSFPVSLATATSMSGATTSLGNATPGASTGLTLRVSNPQPGDSVSRGMYVIQGVAFDSRATGNAGISRVQVFLDPRDAGGQFLGEAHLALNAAGGPFGFQLLAPLPDRKGGHILSIYARSAVADQETSVQIPIDLT